MPREFHATGISITAATSPCAYRCSYCQLADIGVSKISIDRYARIVERFVEYKESKGLTDFGIGQWLGNAFNFNDYEYAKVAEISHKLGDSYENICLGGVPHKSHAEMTEWLAFRRKIGAKNLIVSFLGHGDAHDKWNRKKGSFNFLMESQRIAIELGMGLVQRAFLANSTLPMIERLLDMLDDLGGEVIERVGYPLFYSGLARKFEHERVTMETLDSQSPRIKAIYREDKDKWKSEKDWIEYARNEKYDEHESNWVVLKLDDSNIDKVESMSCEAILADLITRTRAAYASVPAREELCGKYGNKENEKIYMFMWDMECLWLDRYLQDNPIALERHLTHFGR